VSEVPIRDLRNHGGAVIDRVLAGENLIVTRDGKPVAALSPLARAPLSSRALLARWRNVPQADPAALRADIDEVLDTSL
jgi:prevent-host-death family protein